MGMSFGGITSLISANNNKNLNKKIILLDPWFEHFNFEYDYIKEMDQPLLLIQSDNGLKLPILGPRKFFFKSQLKIFSEYGINKNNIIK